MSEVPINPPDEVLRIAYCLYEMHNKNYPNELFINESNVNSLIKDKTAYGLKPRNKEQNMALDLLLDDKIKLVTIVGPAGTGKTLLAVAAGLEQVINQSKKYKRLLVSRPIQPLGNDIGFLPGTLEEKMEPWLTPIKDNLLNLMFRGRRSKNEKDTLKEYIEKGIIEIEAITYIRGRSIADTYMIIDEAQNLSAHELKTIVTRVGDNTKIILTGDIEQIDNVYLSPVSNGLTIAVEKFKDLNLTAHITLLKGERSELATIASKLL
jgi:PhoH-like ATPase